MASHDGDRLSCCCESLAKQHTKMQSCRIRTVGADFAFSISFHPKSINV